MDADCQSQEASPGATDAFERFVEHFRSKVFDYSWRMCGRPEDAEEVAQELSVDDLPPGAEIADDGPQPEMLALDSELRAVLDRAIAELPPSYRAVVLLRLERLSTGENAQILDLGTDVVKQRLSWSGGDAAEARLLLARVGRGVDVGGGDPGIPGRAVGRARRRQDVQLLPHFGRRGCGGDGVARLGIAFRAEFLVPLSLPLRRTEGDRIIGQSAAHSPRAGTLHRLRSARKRRVPAWAIAAAVAGLFVGICGYARWSGHWHSDVPERVYFQWIPRAEEVGHP